MQLGYVVRSYFKKRKKVVFFPIMLNSPEEPESSEEGTGGHGSRSPWGDHAKREAQEDPGSWWQGLRNCSVESSLVLGMNKSDTFEGFLLPPHFCKPHTLQWRRQTRG